MRARSLGLAMTIAALPLFFVSGAAAQSETETKLVVSVKAAPPLGGAYNCATFASRAAPTDTKVTVTLPDGSMKSALTVDGIAQFYVQSFDPSGPTACPWNVEISAVDPSGIEVRTSAQLAPPNSVTLVQMSLERICEGPNCYPPMASVGPSSGGNSGSEVRTCKRKRKKHRAN